MRKASRLMITAVILSAASAVLWGVAVAGIWEPVPERVMPADRAGAVTVTVVAALCWLARWLRRQGDEVYARVIAELVRRQRGEQGGHPRAADSGPLPGL